MYVIYRPEDHFDSIMYLVDAESDEAVKNWLIDQGFTEDDLEDICIQYIKDIHKI